MFRTSRLLAPSSGQRYTLIYRYAAESLQCFAYKIARILSGEEWDEENKIEEQLKVAEEQQPFQVLGEIDYPQMHPINSTTELDHSFYIRQQQPHVISNIGPSGNNNADGQPVAYIGQCDPNNGVVTNKQQNPTQYQTLLTPLTVQQHDPHFYQPLDLTTTTTDANRARPRQEVRSSPVHNNHLPTPQQTGFSSPGLQQRVGYLRNLPNTFGIEAPSSAANATAANVLAFTV